MLYNLKLKVQKRISKKNFNNIYLFIYLHTLKKNNTIKLKYFIK